VVADESMKNIQILVVEDIPLNQLLMKTLLDDFGFGRDVASNGKIAIEKMAVNTYDLVLMDLQMPEMNGFEATDHIRKVLKSNVPIIALTADVTTVDLAKCKAVGMNDYISKPVDERLLYSKIVGLVKKTDRVDLTDDMTDDIENEMGVESISCIDLAYLNTRTKSDPVLMMEMISLYLEQTPPLILAMNKGFTSKDWISLHAALHKMIPSFSIVGIDVVYVDKAKKVQEFTHNLEQLDDIQKIIAEISLVCLQSCRELEVERNRIKTLLG
jgi:CheY-like chemotaxis protein